MNDVNLLQYYLNMREPEAYQWNLSAQSLYLELETRDFFARHFEAFEGIKACNIGVGVGEWDDYLGYRLHGFGKLTSVDIDPDICGLFGYRQAREGHPNPSTVVCGDFVTCDLPAGEFDLVTMIGSTLNEIGVIGGTFEKIGEILKPGGALMYVDFDQDDRKDNLLDLLPQWHMETEKVETYDRFSNIRFFIMKIRKAK